MTETIIKPQKSLSANDVRELYRYRELLYFFVWRDLKVRYKQTAIGVLWAILQPAITLGVFTIIFGKIANTLAGGAPYIIFTSIGLLFWQFFSTAISDASTSLISNQSIITKTYFPRLMLPLASICTRLVDFLAALLIFITIMVWQRFPFPISAIPVMALALLLVFMTALGGGLLLSAINVKYRDVRYALPFFIQILMFVTPVFYAAGNTTGLLHSLLAFNPLTGPINAARAAIIGNLPIDWASLGASALLILLLLIAGSLYFKKTEKYFADII